VRELGVLVRSFFGKGKNLKKKKERGICSGKFFLFWFNEMDIDDSNATDGARKRLVDAIGVL
jgi:hypothetical protein